MSATFHDALDGSRVALLRCESCSTKLRGFTAPDDAAARSVAEREARDAGWHVTTPVPTRTATWGTVAEVPAKHFCPRHHPRKP